MEDEASRIIPYASILLNITHCIKPTSFWLASLNNTHNMTIKLKKKKNTQYVMKTTELHLKLLSTVVMDSKLKENESL